MAALKPVRGTHDLLPKEMRVHRWIMDEAREIAERYGFEEMATILVRSIFIIHIDALFLFGSGKTL